MDIDAFLPKSNWLNNTKLRERGGRYLGVVANVTAQLVRNRYAKNGEPKEQVHPVIEFTDGLRLIPNVPMRRELKDRFGPETDDWVGARLVIVLRVGKNGAGVRHLDWTVDGEIGEADFDADRYNDSTADAFDPASQPVVMFGRHR